MMAATCASLEPEDVPGREQSFRVARSKRPYTETSRQNSVGACNEQDRCEKEGLQGGLLKRANLEVSKLPFLRTAIDRVIPFDISALRQAAASAVAEFNGPQGPSQALTEPDNAHEYKETERQPQNQQAHTPQTSTKSPSRASSGWEASERDRDSHEHGQPQGGADASVLQQPVLGNVFTQRGCPPHGAKAICGRRPRMEDAYTAVPFLLEVPVPVTKISESEILPARIAPQLRSAESSPKADSSEAQEEEPEEPVAHTSADGSVEDKAEDAAEGSESYLETLHFFGVFDGHGGAEAALHCAQTLHQRIAEALAATIDPEADESLQQDGHPFASSGKAELDSQNLLTMPSGLPAFLPPVDEEPETSSEALVDAALAEKADSEGRIDGVACTSASFESALTSAFNRTDEEFGKADNAALVGTTAVVALVGSRQLYVANCGDSRAVLCRSGQAIPLTDDHKAAREDETARVEAAGGHILYWNGVRVMGVLAVSRAIGDHCLRPFVIAQPEVTILVRRPEDEILLLASDGLWDVLNNQEACTLAKRCLRRARQRGASRQSAARIAATVLTRAAVDRGSRDNVTVLVVDLSVGTMEGEDISRAPSAMVPDPQEA